MKTHTIQVTPVIGAAIYVALDAVGALMEFTKVSSKPDAGVVLQSVVLVDEAKQSEAINLILFDSTFTSDADHDILAPSDAELLQCIGHIAIVAGDYVDFSANSIATVRNLNLPIKLSGSSGSLFAQLQTPGTPTYGDAGAITVTLGFDRD